jgi:hypothetical protein
MSMKMQGLINWTDRGRRNYRELEWRNMDVDAHLPFNQIDGTLRRRLSEFGITSKEWDMLRDPAGRFKASNGATFLIPEYWREAMRGKIPDHVAHNILVSVNGMIARGTEQAVPSQSTLIRAFLGEGDNSLAGSPVYELRKSALQFKSFPMAFMRAQYPSGQGFAQYFAGPVVGLASDVYRLGPQNIGELIAAVLSGQPLKTGFAKELGRFGKNYTPLGDTPLIGPFGRMFWDQLTIILDPDAVRALDQAAQRREKNFGNAEWWPSRSPAPARLPDFAGALGR